MRDLSLTLALALLLAGALALASQHRRPPPPVPPSTSPLPGDLPPGERDPRSDLEGQMMLDPITGTYLGG